MIDEHEVLVEGFGGGIWWRCWWQLGGSWKRQIVEASVEGFGGGIWWRKMVEALVEGSGADEVSALGDTTIEFSPTQHFGNVCSVVMMHMCGEINEREESGA